jgi:hypothetical protein
MCAIRNDRFPCLGEARFSDVVNGRKAEAAPAAAAFF